MREKWRIYQNYIIIGILSTISIFFLPMLGSDVDIGLKLPKTTAGWVVWVLTKLSIIFINMLMLDQFIRQGKVNIKDNPKYNEANDYFNEQEEEEFIPTPKQFLGGLYRNKLITTLIISSLGVFGLTQAILTFDWVSMLTYSFTIVFGIIFGWITMNNVEEYWTETYYKLYKRAKKEQEKCLK